jgi:hypothetical protein
MTRKLVLLWETNNTFFRQDELGEIVSKLATVDGFSIRGITRSEFIRKSMSKRGYKLPKNESDVMALIHRYERYKTFFQFSIFQFIFVLDIVTRSSRICRRNNNQKLTVIKI